MIADAAEVAGAGVGAEGLLPGMSGVPVRQERYRDCHERAGRDKIRRGKAEVDELPLPIEANAPLRHIIS